MSYETRYAAHMRQKSDAAASTPEAEAARLRLQEALTRACSDTVARFPTWTPDDVDAVLEYQAERIEHWRRELNA